MFALAFLLLRPFEMVFGFDFADWQDYLALELRKTSGSWPQVMVDDPKNWLGHATPLYDGLFHVVAYLEAFSGAWMIVFWTLFFAARPKFALGWRRTFVALTTIATLIFLFDPGNLYAWWLD